MELSIIFEFEREVGGTFQQSVNNLLDLKKFCDKSNIKLSIISHKKQQFLDNLNIQYEVINLKIFDKIFLLLKFNIFFKYLIKRYHFISSFEKKLLKKKTKLIIFLSTSYKALLFQKINIITTVHDVCDLDFPEFSEVRSYQSFFFRDYLRRKILPQSALILVESEQLKKKLCNFYSLNKDRIVSIPNSTSHLFSKNLNTKFIDETKRKYQLPNYFFFYPAQFWSHKNHMIILKAVKKIKEYDKKIFFVFCGKNKGNLAYIKRKINEYNIKKFIKILDYVKDNEVQALYKLSSALVMPTYLGPTNLPPIEAWNLGVPVLYSSFFKDHGKNAALYFNPNFEDELVEGIRKLKFQSIRLKLIANGQKRYKNIISDRNKGFKNFIRKLLDLKCILDS